MQKQAVHHRHACLFIIMLTVFLMLTCQSQSPVKEGTITVGSADIYYKMMGQGTPTFILHGGPGDTHDTMLQLAPLKDQFKLVFYDQRAAGRSTGDADTASHTIEQFVEDLEQLRLALGSDKINILGGSWGTMVAMQYAMKYSDHIHGMVLMSCMGVRAEYLEEYRANIVKARAPEDNEKLEEIFASDGFKERKPDAVENFWRTYFRAYCCDPAYADSLHLWIQNTKAEEAPGRYVRLGQFIATYDITEDVKRISCPTLILHGKCDPTPVEWVTPIHEGIKGSEMREINNAGHWLWVEGANQVLPIIRSYLEEV